MTSAVKANESNIDLIIKLNAKNKKLEKDLEKVSGLFKKLQEENSRLTKQNPHIIQTITDLQCKNKQLEQQRFALLSENGQLKSQLQQVLGISSQKDQDQLHLFNHIHQMEQEIKQLRELQPGVELEQARQTSLELRQLNDQLNLELDAKDELLDAAKDEIGRLAARIAEYAATDAYLL